MRNTIKIIIFFLFFISYSYAKLIEKHKYIIDNISSKNNAKTVYLTFDICNSREDFNVDMKILDFLINNKINSTFFISGRFLTKQENRDFVKNLAEYDFFSIQNHGLKHKPLSLKKNNIYGIRSTRNKKEVLAEVYDNENLIKQLTNKKTTWYRSGTATYDIEAIKLIKNDYKIAGFATSIDKGATLTNKEIYENRFKIKSGDIILIHINHPEKNTSKGVIKVIKYLKKKGFRFEKLE